MRSLKRSATSYLDQAVGHKRKCSNPSSRPSTTPTHDNNTDAPLKFQRRKPAQHMLHAEVPVHCIHKHASACALLMKICCSCADKRPITHAYPMYVDGRGIGPSDDRSLHYCFGCQGTSRNGALYESQSDQVQHIGDVVVVILSTMFPHYHRWD